MPKQNKMLDPPKKTARTETPRYFAYILSVRKVEYIENKKEAKTFERENSDIIVDTIEFFTSVNRNTKTQ